MESDWSNFFTSLLFSIRPFEYSRIQIHDIHRLPAWSLFATPSRRQVVFSCLAYTANKGASVISDRVYVSSSVGALVIGICGNVYGRFSRGGSYTSAVPGLMFLVPVRDHFFSPPAPLCIHLLHFDFPAMLISDQSYSFPTIHMFSRSLVPTDVKTGVCSRRWVSKVDSSQRTRQTRRQNLRISVRSRWG